MMKNALKITALITFATLAACSDQQEETMLEASISEDPAMSYDAFEEISKHPDSSITRDGDWKVVTKVEKGKRVYWFVAPDVDNVSPALFKKTIQTDNKNVKETLTVSKCEAPKKTCDSLMEQFKTMSEKYK